METKQVKPDSLVCAQKKKALRELDKIDAIYTHVSDSI